MYMRIIITTLLFFPISLLAQLEFRRSNAIHVSENGDILDFAWAGGINSSQWSNIDLNNDGTDDIPILTDMNGITSMEF